MLLRLAGPLQSWGDASRFTTRSTRESPTKSGVVGLLAAALGRRRTDPLEDLLGLTFGVRTDQSGVLTRDFQTAEDRAGKSKPLSYRYYLADAVFLAAIEGDDALIEGLVEALRRPTFPLYLGRRSCPPAGPLYLKTVPDGCRDALLTHPWLAADWHRRKLPRRVSMPIARDARADETGTELVRDIPVSFAAQHRDYSWRSVVHERTPEFDNNLGLDRMHDPMALLGGG